MLLVFTPPLITIGAGLVIGWLWLRTESIWMVALAHGAHNNWGQYAFKFMDDGGPGGEPRDLLVLAAGGLALLAVGASFFRMDGHPSRLRNQRRFDGPATTRGTAPVKGRVPPILRGGC